MWSRSKRDRCFRTSLLVINCAACVAITYIFLRYAGKLENNHASISSEDFIQPEKLTSEECTPVCESRACIWHANMFLKHINPTVDPCEDFLSFLCSGFQREFGPEEKATVMSENKGPLLIRLKSILDNLQAEPGSGAAKMKTVYDSCVNYGSSELQGIRDIKSIFNNLGFFNWPNLAQDFHFSDVSLPAMLGNFLTYVSKPFIGLKYVSGNGTDELKVFFSLDTFYKTTEIPRELAVSMLKYFDLEAEDIDMIIKDHELVKNSIINLYESSGDCEKETCSVIRINCSRQNEEDWHEFCETLGFVFSSMNINIAAITHLIQIERSIDEEPFFKNLFPLLHYFPDRSLANFVVLTLLKGYQAELNFYFRLSKLKQKDFDDETKIKLYELDRWRYCVRWIAGNMKIALENEFMRQYLTNEVTEEVINIYKNFSSELIDLFIRQEWIPTMASSYVAAMLRSTAFNVDFLSQIFPNDTYVSKVYEKFIPTSESFFSNVLRLKKSLITLPSSKDSFNMKDRIPLETEFDVDAATGGPFLYIHFGMLIPPFYVPGHLSLMNSIVLAPIVGHETGHIIFDSLGIILRDDETFLDKRQCVRDQFSRFKFEYLNENLNGSSFEDESIPDNIATTLIDEVIEKYSATQDIILPGLPYSTKQLLYMSSVQMWCSKSSLEKDIHHKNSDPHAPDGFRLFGMMQNSRGHPEAFQCPDGSFMNPATKCSLLDTNGR